MADPLDEVFVPSGRSDDARHSSIVEQHPAQALAQPHELLSLFWTQVT